MLPIVSDSHQVEPAAFGGGLDGAERRSRETARWSPSMQSPDQIINSAKPLADARGRDMVQNDGYASGAANLHKDNIFMGDPSITDVTTELNGQEAGSPET